MSGGDPPVQKTQVCVARLLVERYGLGEKRSPLVIALCGLVQPVHAAL